MHGARYVYMYWSKTTTVGQRTQKGTYSVHNMDRKHAVSYLVLLVTAVTGVKGGAVLRRTASKQRRSSGIQNYSYSYDTSPSTFVRGVRGFSAGHVRACAPSENLSQWETRLLLLLLLYYTKYFKVRDRTMVPQVSMILYYVIRVVSV